MIVTSQPLSKILTFLDKAYAIGYTTYNDIKYTYKERGVFAGTDKLVFAPITYDADMLYVYVESNEVLLYESGDETYIEVECGITNEKFRLHLFTVAAAKLPI